MWINLFALAFAAAIGLAAMAILAGGDDAAPGRGVRVRSVVQ